MADSTDEEIIELTQMVEEEISDTEEILELSQVAQDSDALVLEDPVTPEKAEPPQIKRPDREVPDAGLTDPDTISQEQLDAALERVIEKKFGRHIEKILFEVTETVIRREIAEIKASLQQDLDDIDNA